LTKIEAIAEAKLKRQDKWYNKHCLFQIIHSGARPLPLLEGLITAPIATLQRILLRGAGAG
jgi:hypothetical protein